MNKLAILALVFAMPLLASAQQVRNIQDAAALITTIINSILVPLIFALAFIVFIWGVFTYFIAAGENDEKRETGKKLMLYGIGGFFIMVAVWGLVNLLLGTFQLNNNLPNLPGAPGPR